MAPPRFADYCSELFENSAPNVRVRRTDGIWVVHGHTITERARPKDGRIPVDTGAYATGRLTAALLETGKVQFFST